MNSPYKAQLKSTIYQLSGLHPDYGRDEAAMANEETLAAELKRQVPQASEGDIYEAMSEWWSEIVDAAQGEAERACDHERLAEKARERSDLVAAALFVWKKVYSSGYGRSMTE